MTDARKGDRHQRVLVAVRLKASTHERLREEAEARDLPMTYLVERAVDLLLERLVPVEEWKLTR